MQKIFQYVAPLAAAIGLATCSDSNAPDVTPAAIAITSSASGTIVSGQTANLTAVVTNAGGGTIANPKIDWISADQTIATVSASGVVTGLHVGTTQITASIGTIRSLGVAVTVIAGAPAQLGVRTPPGGASSGLALVTQPVIEVRDGAGNLVASTAVTVTATIATGGGTLTGSTAQSVDGVATFSALAVSGLIGDRTLTFSAPGLGSVTSSGFALTPGNPTRLAIRVQLTGAASGAPVAAPPQIEVRDDAGNIVTSAGPLVTAAIGSGSGRLTNPSATAVNGVATFAGLIISGAAGSHTLAFSAPGLTSASSDPFMLTAGAPTQLHLRMQPDGASLGKPLGTQPVVEVDDDGGNTVDVNVDVTATIASGGGTLAGDKAVADTGVATFTSLTITGQLGPHTLTFSASGLSPVTSSQFSVTSGGATKLSIKVQPTGSYNGRPLTQQPVIEIQDDQDNVVTGYSGTVLATVPDKTALVSSGSADVVNGVATFYGLALTGSGAVTIAFQSGSLPPVTAFPLVVQTAPAQGPPSGPVHQLVVLVAPPLSAPNGSAMSPQPVVEALDANGNPVTTPVTINFITDAVSGTVTNGSATTVNGIAHFNGLTLAGPFGARNYWFTAAGAPNTTIYRITIP